MKYNDSQTCGCISKGKCIHAIYDGANECGPFKNWLFDVIDGWCGRDIALRFVGGDVFRFNIPMRNNRGIKPTFERFGRGRVPVVIERYA